MGTSDQGVNNNSQTYVAYAWKAGGGGGAQGNSGTFSVDDVSYASAAAAGMDGGDINPTGCSVGTKQGFSIIRYTGNQGTGQTLNHGLGAIPDFVICKNLGTTYNWFIWHNTFGNGADAAIYFTNAVKTTGYVTQPFGTFTTSSLAFNYNDGVNGAYDYICYAWKNVPGLQRFSYYKGTGSATTGPFVFTGFRPALIIIKGSDEDKHWTVWDKNVNPINPTSQYLIWPSNAAGEQSGMAIDILSNGFKIRTSDSQINNGGKTYIYMAWADQPEHNLYGGQSNAR